MTTARKPRAERLPLTIEEELRMPLDLSILEVKIERLASMLLEARRELKVIYDRADEAAFAEGSTEMNEKAYELRNRASLLDRDAKVAGQGSL